MNEAPPALVAYSCPKCHRHLVDAPHGASVSCPKCGVWATAPIKRRKDAPRESRASPRAPDRH